MNISLIVEIALSVLLAATVIYCAILERKLSALRKGQDDLKTTIGELNEAIVSAGASMRMLKVAAAGAAENLDERMSRGRSIIDELSLLVGSGERIAERMERGAPAKAAMTGTSRLEALRTVR